MGNRNGNRKSEIGNRKSEIEYRIMEKENRNYFITIKLI